MGWAGGKHSFCSHTGKRAYFRICQSKGLFTVSLAPDLVGSLVRSPKLSELHDGFTVAKSLHEVDFSVSAHHLLQGLWEIKK